MNAFTKYDVREDMCWTADIGYLESSQVFSIICLVADVTIDCYVVSNKAFK